MTKTCKATQGISKERLIQLRSYYADKKVVFAILIEDLISHECQELNLWWPINRNTPSDRRVLLFFPNLPASSRIWVDYYSEDMPYTPTHWQELPPDPKLPEPQNEY